MNEEPLEAAILDTELPSLELQEQNNLPRDHGYAKYKAIYISRDDEVNINEDLGQINPCLPDENHSTSSELLENLDEILNSNPQPVIKKNAFVIIIIIHCGKVMKTIWIGLVQWKMILEELFVTLVILRFWLPRKVYSTTLILTITTEIIRYQKEIQMKNFYLKVQILMLKLTEWN